MLNSLKNLWFQALNRFTARPDNAAFARLTQAMGEPVRDMEEAAQKIEAFIRETRAFEVQCQDIVGKLRDELVLHENFAAGIRAWAASWPDAHFVVLNRIIQEFDAALPSESASTTVQRAAAFSSAPPQH